ncbi:MAG: hypothetical protein JWQ03_3024 [Variovorax sp.]|nr:hypothetical protein [Variovorax sp.]
MKSAFRSTFVALLAAGSLAGLAPVALAQSHAAKPRQAQGQCDGVQQDRTACLREAAAAQQAARSHGLVSAAPNVYEQNALARCQFQPPADRTDCEARVRGSGNTSIEGNVMGGGLLRQTARPAPALAPASEPTR